MLGLISGSAAEAAGIQQGDQLLELDGQQLAGQSPFAVASLLQGQEQQEGLGLENPAVQVKASAACLCCCCCCCKCASNSRDGRHLHLPRFRGPCGHPCHFSFMVLAFLWRDKPPFPPALSLSPPILHHLAKVRCASLTAACSRCGSSGRCEWCSHPWTRGWRAAAAASGWGSSSCPASTRGRRWEGASLQAWCQNLS